MDATPHLDLLALAEPFDVSELALLHRRDLLRRVDTKFVTPLDELGSILRGLEGCYAKVLAEGTPWETYETLYFDTPEERCFHDHRRGRLGRCKVRVRHYHDRRLSFFEVKLKSNHGVTTKLRHPKDYRSSTMTPQDNALAASAPGLPTSALVPRLWTCFSRLHLVSLEQLERVTIDVGVRFRHGRGDAAAIALDELARSTAFERRLVRDPTPTLRPLVIVEVKQSSFSGRTPFMLALRRANARPRRASKYCTGVMLTSSTPRANRFLPNLKLIARLQCSKPWESPSSSTSPTC